MKTNNKKHKENLLLNFAKSALNRSVELALNEEAVKMVSEFPHPKDLVSILTEQAEKGKDEVFKLLAQEFVKAFTKIDFKDEIVKFLKTHQLNISVEINPKQKAAAAREKAKAAKATVAEKTRPKKR